MDNFEILNTIIITVSNIELVTIVDLIHSSVGHGIRRCSNAEYKSYASNLMVSIWKTLVS